MITHTSLIDYSYGEWAMTLDGHHIGYASSYSAAATTINQTAFEWAMAAIEVSQPASPYFRCPNCRSDRFPTSTLIPTMCVECEKAITHPAQPAIFGQCPCGAAAFYAVQWTDTTAALCHACYEQFFLLPIILRAAHHDAAQQTTLIKAERCHCGAPACWEVAFAEEPHYEYFCAAHLDRDYRADPIAWPAGRCTNCNGAHSTDQCPTIRALLLAPECCINCGDILVGPVRICAECRWWNMREAMLTPIDVDYAITGFIE